MAMKEFALDNIQGNILAGFNKDFQTFLFLKFKNSTAGRAWITEISNPGVEFSVAKSSCTEVLRFNAQFKALKAEGKKPTSFIEAAWTNVAISFQGFQALGIAAADLGAFPSAFGAGMAARKDVLGDIGPSDPSHWPAPFGAGDIHALLLVAADNETKLAARVAAIKGSALFSSGVTVVNTIEGRTRMDIPKQAGHEHFGFKDGVSQPGIRGITLPDDPVGNPDQGHPGQDLLWPGEFALGYPTQKPTAEPGHDGPNREPGPISEFGTILDRRWFVSRIPTACSGCSRFSRPRRGSCHGARPA